MSFKTPGQENETHISALLRQIVSEVPEGNFTLGWLIGSLPKRSFGIILLFLSMIAVVPVISFPACLLILVLASQIVMGYPAPVLPRRWLDKPLPSLYLKKMEAHALPLLENLEKVVRPRWAGFLTYTRRLAACTVILLAIMALLNPVPFSNIPPAIICILMALSYIEHDGLLLLAAYMLALGLLFTVARIF